MTTHHTVQMNSLSGATVLNQRILMRHRRMCCLQSKPHKSCYILGFFPYNLRGGLNRDICMLPEFEFFSHEKEVCFTLGAGSLIF